MELFEKYPDKAMQLADKVLTSEDVYKTGVAYEAIAKIQASALTPQKENLDENEDEDNETEEETEDNKEKEEER